MRAWAWIVVGVALAGPATGQSSEFARAIDYVRYAGRVIARAGQCTLNHERTERLSNAVVQFLGRGHPRWDQDLISSAMSIEIAYYNDPPDRRLCADWTMRLWEIEQTIR